MADISKVILPNESEYDIKDTTARSQASSATATANSAMSLANAANNRASSAQSVASAASSQASNAYTLANSAVQTVNGISPDTNKNVQTDVELTQAEYDALPSSKLTDGVNYWIKDGNNNPLNNTVMASGVAYDNTESGLSATNVQGAVDELSGVLMKPVLLWEGDKTGSGSITIDGLSEWMIVAYCNYASNDYILIGSPLRGGFVYGMYDTNSTATMGYRFTGNLNSDTITIDNLNRGIYVGSNSTYSSSSTGQSDVHIRRVYGLFRKPQS